MNVDALLPKLDSYDLVNIQPMIHHNKYPTWPDWGMEEKCEICEQDIDDCCCFEFLTEDELKID